MSVGRESSLSPSGVSSTKAESTAFRYTGLALNLLRSRANRMEADVVALESAPDGHGRCDQVDGTALPMRLGGCWSPSQLLLSYPESTLRDVPRISQFYGITILMFFGDHEPPHFHARYGGLRARFKLAGELLDGDMPSQGTAHGSKVGWVALGRASCVLGAGGEERGAG